MICLTAIVIHAVLLSAGQEHTTRIHVTQASVSYHVDESTLRLTKKTVVGRNEDVAVDFLASPEAVTGKLLISSSQFRTGVPLRDRSVRIILKSDEHPKIVFELLKIEGEDLGKVLRPIRDGLALSGDLRKVSLDITRMAGANGDVILSAGGNQVRVTGKLKDNISRALNSGSGDVRVAGRLTVGGASKIYDCVVSFIHRSDTELFLSTRIEAAFSDFGIPPPNIGVVVVSTPDRISLVGDAVVTLTK